MVHHTNLEQTYKIYFLTIGTYETTKVKVYVGKHTKKKYVDQTIPFILYVHMYFSQIFEFRCFLKCNEIALPKTFMWNVGGTFDFKCTIKAQLETHYV